MRHLSPEALELVEWTFEDKSLLEAGYRATEIGQIWETIPGGHKWIDYFPVYERLLTRFRN